MKNTEKALLFIAAVGLICCIEVVSYNYFRHETQSTERLTGETQPGPVEPVPRIEDHVAMVMQQECPACPDCPTWDALRRAGLEVICENAFGRVPSVNYWPEEMPMVCNKIREVKVAPHIKVIVGKK